MRRVALIFTLALFALPAAAGASPAPEVSMLASSSANVPSARVGAFYFDGWSGPLSNFHFRGLLGTEFSGRKPLSGWRDNTLAALRAQLYWARAAGIGFFVFDWYYEPHPGNGPINMARDNYLKLRARNGVGFALNYVNQPPFVIPPDRWAAVAEKWVTENFLDPDYVRVDGKPLLVIIDEAFFTRQMGGADGVNSAIAELQTAAKRHGLPGVFVVGGRYLDWTSESCFPVCIDTDIHFAREHYDAITEFSYPRILEPAAGPRSYADVAIAIKRAWDVVAERSPFPHIPGVMAGLDARPMILAGQVQAPEEGGWPLLNGHTTWFETTAADVALLVKDAVTWVEEHPSMRVEPAPAPPIVLIQSWNELQEGAILVPTRESGYSYIQALAEALGVAWTAPPRYRVAVTSSEGGIVKSAPAGLTCPRRCRASFDRGWEVTLRAIARPGYVFAAWRGDCRSRDVTCTFIVERNKSIRADFVKLD